MNARQNSTSTPTTAQRRRLFYALVLLVIVGASIVLKFNHPSEITGLPACPSISTLGVTCPGCGSLRATHLLLNAEIAAAWRHNPALIILGLPAFGLLLIECCLGALGREPLVVRRAPGWFGWAVLIAVLVYFAARNVPVWDWLRPPL